MPVDLRLRRLRALPLVAVLGVGLALGSPPAKAANCSGTSVGITPLNDLGSGSYRGSQGGLYPGGANTRPPDHEAAGLVLASAIEPLDPTGRPDPNGRYALISIGMSNTTMEFQTFQATADQQPEKDPHLVLVDGGQGGVTATKWAAPDNRAWQVLDERLAAKAVTREQVAVAWVKLANANPRSGWPTHAEELEADMQRVVQNLRDRFPNIRIAYLSSRIYAGYSTSSLNPEPYAYESGFSVKLLLQKQIGGDPELNADPRRGRVRAPWLSWGPYLWADGTLPRTDGLTWTCGDFGDDGTHPSPAGREKVARLLLDFFRTDSTALPWFLTTQAGVQPAPSATTTVRQPAPSPPSAVGATTLPPGSTTSAPVATGDPPTTGPPGDDDDLAISDRKGVGKRNWGPVGVVVVAALTLASVIVWLYRRWTG